MSNSSNTTDNGNPSFDLSAVAEERGRLKLNDPVLFEMKNRRYFYYDYVAPIITPDPVRPRPNIADVKYFARVDATPAEERLQYYKRVSSASRAFALFVIARNVPRTRANRYAV